MRKLLTACCSLAAAVFAAYYFLSAPGSFTAAGAACILTAVLFFLRKRDRLFLSLFLIALGAAVGFTAYGIHWNGTIRHAEAWDGEEQMIPVRVMEAPIQGDFYIRLHVQRTEAPKLDLMLYDYRGNLDPETEPGSLLNVTARLRRADLRYGERNDNYVSKNIYMTGTLLSAEPLPGCSVTPRTLAALCSRKISNFASGFFSPDTSVFLRSLMLGDKTDFYRDLPLYVSMRGAGFMHIVAVSGVQYLFFGFNRIARKPVNSGFFGTRPLKCTRKLHFT